MKTIANGLILKGIDLSPVKENIVIDDESKIIEISKDAKEGEIIDLIMTFKISLKKMKI